MIQITVFKDKDCYTGFCMKGHAGYAQSGQDIVCSAVSVLAINTVNAIEQFTQDTYIIDADEEAGGSLEFHFSEAPGHDSCLLMNVMVMGLESIADSYGEFIQIDMEEV